MTVVSEKTGDCLDFELLISKACDGECAPEETEALRVHLQECEECRCVLSEYRQVRDFMIARLVAFSCPPAPQISRRRSALSGLKNAFSPRRFAGGLAAAAVCAMFFFMGHQTGALQSKPRLQESMPSNVSATPSMWIVNRRADSAAWANVESEQPFNESIARYRAAIGIELRQKKVDWLKVRELVEAMGELRTDLELLTLHMAYLDICTGASPSEVADHWEKLGVPGDGKAVLRQ